MRKMVARICLCLPVLCGCGLAAGQDYPNRTITIIVPAAPGGGNDTTARPLAQVLGKILGQSVTVVNRPGAGGAIGAAFTAAAKPDGYTVVMPLATVAAIPEADLLYGRKPSFTMDQFTSIALVSADPDLL